MSRLATNLIVTHPSLHFLVFDYGSKTHAMEGVAKKLAPSKFVVDVFYLGPTRLSWGL